MSESSEAAEQMVRMMLSGGEAAIRLSGSAMKNSAALLLALARSHKRVFGKVRLVQMLRETRDIRQFQMTPEQFRTFKKMAKKKKVLYSAIRDRLHPSALVDVLLPITEVERANMVFEDIKYIPPNSKQQAQQPLEKQEEQAPKKEDRWRRGSPGTRDNSSISKGKEKKTTSERLSIEQRLKENKALLERQRKKDPIRLRSKGRGRGR